MVHVDAAANETSETEESTAVCHFSSVATTVVGDASAEIISVCGLHARAFDPSIERDPLGNVKWTVKLQDIWTALENTWTEVSGIGETAEALPQLKDTRHVIWDAQHTRPLVAMGTESANPEDLTPQCAVPVESVTCEVCGMTDIALPMLRHHMGAHLIQKDWACYSKTKPEEPCGLCGVRPAYGQFLLDSKIVASCPVSLEKNGATWRAVHQCKYQGKYCKYSLGDIDALLLCHCRHSLYRGLSA